MLVNDILLENQKPLKYGDKVKFHKVQFTLTDQGWQRESDQAIVPVGSKQHQLLMGLKGYAADGVKPIPPTVFQKLTNWANSVLGGELGMATRNDPNASVLGKLLAAGGDGLGRLLVGGVRKAAGALAKDKKDAVTIAPAQQDKEDKKQARDDRGAGKAAPDPEPASSERVSIGGQTLNPNNPEHAKIIAQINKESVRRPISNRLMEGGAMSGAGAIHIDEIEPTLIKMERDLGLNLRDNVLGSVGKKEFSGDIDVAVEMGPEELAKFAQKLEATPSIIDMKKSSVIMTKVAIQGYDESKQTDKPRTGFVQLDFMPGNPEWLKTYYWAPNKGESEHTGTHRNILIAVAAGELDREESTEQTEHGYPLWQERYMWSPRDGLVRVKRTPKPRANGDGYTKAFSNEIIDGPWKTTKEIAKVLRLDAPEDLNSYEQIKSVINKNYPAPLVAAINDKLLNDPSLQKIGMPKDI